MNWGVTQCIWKTLKWNIEIKLAKFEQLSRITALDLGVYVFCASPNFGKSLWLCWCCGIRKCLPASASLKLNLGTYHLPFLPRLWSSAKEYSGIQARRQWHQVSTSPLNEWGIRIAWSRVLLRTCSIAKVILQTVRVRTIYSFFLHKPGVDVEGGVFCPSV